MGNDERESSEEGGKERPVAQSHTNYTDEDDVPLSKLIPQIRVEGDGDNVSAGRDETNTGESKSGERSNDVNVTSNKEVDEEDPEASPSATTENETIGDKSNLTADTTASKEQARENKEDSNESPNQVTQTSAEVHASEDENVLVTTNENDVFQNNPSSDDNEVDRGEATSREKNQNGKDEIMDSGDKNEPEDVEMVEEGTDAVTDKEEMCTDRNTLGSQKAVELSSDNQMDIDQTDDAVHDSEAKQKAHLSDHDDDKNHVHPSDERREAKIDLDSDGEDVYEAFNKKSSALPLTRKKKTPLRIVIAGVSEVAAPSVPMKLPAVKSRTYQSPLAKDITREGTFSCDFTEVEKELEESLKFFEQPHEDQDLLFVEFQRKEQKAKLEAELKKLNEEEEAGKREIEIIVSQQLKEKQVSTEKSVEKYKLKTAAEEKKELAKLQQLYDEKCKSNQSKIDQGVMVLRKRNAEETKKLMQQHRLQVQHRQVSQEQANAEWSQLSERLQGKHQRLMAEFAGKGEQVKQKCLAEFQRDSAKLRKIYEKKHQDLDANRQAIYTKIHTGFQQVRQRYLKRHSQAIAAKREALLRKNAGLVNDKVEHQLPTREKTKSDLEEKEELRPPSPIKTSDDWVRASPNEPSGAASRHKHRKAVLSQINKQLSVEIHNEGIWISQLGSEDSDKNKNNEASSQEKQHFIPWGVKARVVLESIICGEIPEECGLEGFDFGDSVSANAGHLRCVMTDLRTSNESAASQRVEAILHQELNEASKIENRMRELQTNILGTEKGIEQITKTMKELEIKLAENVKEVEKTKSHYQAFRNKFARYFGPDGKILPATNPGDKEKLNQALMKWRSALENGQKRDRAIREKIAEAKGIAQKKQSQVNQAQRTLRAMAVDVKKRRTQVDDVRSGKAKPSNRYDRGPVSDSINLLKTTAGLRRDELNSKRNSSTSNAWVQSLPSIPGSLKRSFWYKMHRRRQQIVLRPTFASLLSDLQKQVGLKLSSLGLPQEKVDSELIRAEQNYLLAIHPIAPEGETVSSSPSATTWAEPGWYLNLVVPKEDTADVILPRAAVYPLVQRNLSELCSAPGRQAASMLRCTHLRSLENPLSAIGTATSLAETNPSMTVKGPAILHDPLRMTPEEAKVAYNFVIVKSPVTKPVMQRKRSSSSKDAPPSPAKSTKRKPISAPKLDPGSKTGAAVNRKRKSSAQAENTTARAVQRRKTEVAKQQQSQQHLQQQRPMQQPIQQPVQQPIQQPIQQQMQQQPSPLQQQQIQQPQYPPMNDQAFQPRPIMTQPQHPPQLQPQPGPPRQIPMTQQQQGNQYNQFMGAMPSPIGTQQQRGSFSQFPNTPQMNQFRMMQHQQQQQQQPGQQQMNYGQHPQAMQQIPQFFPQMGQQQYPQQHMQQLSHSVIGPPGTIPMNMQPTTTNANSGQPNSGNNNMNIRQNNMPSADDQNDPLFMLKEM
ncbi:hypothetical protein IV203_029941 [Nitzschia inconspicua]|uniref:Uncharacterized protein n=1 Tax=Nitzschia inconspicua TaxID=303405 RepID=A0A9K3Q1P3_9STRA|nr:hypothetical protein IV203_029941 [Nitzschia inconspicua]